MLKSFHTRKKRIVLFFTFLFIAFGIITITMRLTNPLLSAIIFSPKTNYPADCIWGNGETSENVKKIKIIKLLAGRQIVRDDSQKDIGNQNGAKVYLIYVKTDSIMAYYDTGDEAVVSYQGKYYRITNPEHPVW